MMTGAEALIQGLEELEVELIFGYPGGAILPVYHELRKSSIKHILPRSEQGAAHAASGYARVSGKVGVCMATSGPGATNLVTGLATAYMDSIPVVAITGQVATKMIGTDAFQEVDITGITQPITKHNYLVTKADDIPRILAEAFFIAKTGRPGPVLIDIPKDVAEAVCCAKFSKEVSLPGYKPTYKGHTAQIKSACNAISKARKPLIYAGGGVISSMAWSQLQQVAEILQCPVVTTLMGKGAMPQDHPLYLGMLGMHGLPAANLAAMSCDVLLAVGARFDDRVTGLPQRFAAAAKIIHIDIDPAEISKNINSQIPIVGDVKTVLEEMIPRLTSENDTAAWRATLNDYRDRNGVIYGRTQQESLTSFRIIDSISRLADERTVVTTDVGQHQMAAAQFFHCNRPGGFLTSGGLGTMGYGVPAALGAQLADPEALVICFTGDGSIQMSINELATIKAHNLPVKIVLLNNQCLALVRQLQHTYCEKQFFAVDMPGNPDFVAVAKAYGFEAYRIEDNSQIDGVLDRALNNGMPTLIDCAISKEDLIYPIVEAGKALDEMTMP